jgi:hypothetical protein
MVQDFSFLFAASSTVIGGRFNPLAVIFYEDISDWNVSGATNMEGMFYAASSFNQPIGAWDVSSVTRLEYMFADAISFNQPIGAWDVSSVTNVRQTPHRLDYMFHQATAFRQNLCPWARKLPEALNVMEMLAYTSCPNPHGPNPYGTCDAVLENFCFDCQPDNTTAEVQEAACLSSLPNDLDGWTMVSNPPSPTTAPTIWTHHRLYLRQPTFSAGLTILPISGMRFSLLPATDPSGRRQTTRILRAVGSRGLPIPNLRHASVVQNPWLPAAFLIAGAPHPRTPGFPLPMATTMMAAELVS